MQELEWLSYEKKFTNEVQGKTYIILALLFAITEGLLDLRLLYLVDTKILKHS